MRITRQILPVLLLVLGLYSLTGCGGGTASSLAQMNQPGSSIDGVTSGSFKAVRYNDHGYQDSALNPTLSLNNTTVGSTTTVTVAVSDQTPMIGACVDVYYDATKFSPVKAEFNGLVATPLELASTATTGIVSVGQADVNGTAVRNGQFATITFAAGPSRIVSAAGDAHNVPVNYVYPKTPAAGVTIKEDGFEITKPDTTGGPATYSIYSTWAIGDGDMNGTSNLADLTAMVFNGYYTKVLTDTTNLGTAATDYDGNCATTIADLTPLGQHLNQGTTGIDVFIADNDGATATDPHTFTGTETKLTSFTWAAGTQPVRPPAASITDLDAVYVKWDGTVTAGDVTAADTNADGKVYLSARTTGTGAAGPLFSDATKVIGGGGPPPPPAGVSVTGFDVTVSHTGADIPFNNAGGDLPLQAGDTAVVINITGVSGNFDDDGAGPDVGMPFTASTGHSAAAGDHLIPQTDYDATLASIQGQTTWTMTTQGNNAVNEFHTAAPVLTLSSTTGTGITGSVTVDSDPESTLATTPEGHLRADVLASGTAIPVDITYDFKVDVTEDPAAPLLTQLSSDGPIQGNYLGIKAVGSTSISAKVTLGTQALPADRTQIQVHLVDLTDPVGDVNLQYLAAGQLADGQFRFDEPQSLINAQVSGVAIQGHLYGIRMILPTTAPATTSSTVNLADGTIANEPFLKAAPAPAPVTFSTLPAKEDYTPVNKVVDIMYPDPVIRRDTRVSFAGQTAVPPNPAGYADIIKTSGNEFAPARVQVTGQGLRTFPAVIAIAGTDPATITASTVADPLVNAVYWCPSGIVLDISAVTAGPNDASYAFKLFAGAATTANWVNLGTGTFNYHAAGIANSGFDAVDFGVNAFDNLGRGDRDLASRSYADKDLDGSSVNTAKPDVLFVEFYGYKFLEFDGSKPFYSDPGGLPYESDPHNTILRLFDGVANKTMDVSLVPRTAALDAGGHMIATFVPTKEYWSKSGTPGWLGILTPSGSYTVTLVDQQDSNQNFTFATPLTCSGNDPNV